MTHGVRLYLVGSIVLVSLAGCGRGLFQSKEREPWRAEAEIACLKSGAVKETADLVRISPISGPGVCGADFPLKVAALGESNGGLGFADEELRPPVAIGGNQPRWPGSQPLPPPASTYSETAVRQPGYGAEGNGPISLTAPGVAADEDDIELPPEGAPGMSGPRYPSNVGPRDPGPQAYPPRDRASTYPDRPNAAYGSPQDRPLPRLGPADGGTMTGALGPVAVRPEATLACPIVSVLDRWLADSVQPAAMRWFGARVVEIKQISAYSCRGMNGSSRAHISEHAFGNALDIAAFTLADGRRISVEQGWKGMPEEQGFLRDVQAGACERFNTVLAPGSNVYHYNHIHVDLMRRARRPVICEPAPVSGEEVAARVSQRTPYASRDPAMTGSLGTRKLVSHRRNADDDDEDD